jgi:PAS domain S-box-containing protein
VIGHDDLEYFAHRNRPLDEAMRRQRLWRRAIEQGRATQWDEVIEPHAGAEWRYMRRYAQPVFDAAGRPTMLIGYGIDITEIREAQLIHEQAEKRFRDLMHYSHALICTHTLEGVVLSVNPAVCDLLRVSESRLVGRYIGLAVPSKDRLGVVRYLEQFTTGPDAHASGVMRLQPAGTKEIRHLLYHNVRVDEPGQTPYIIGYAQDVTERIRADKATRQAKEAAEAAARARTSFLANMSHEIRTPLNGILGLAGQLAKTTLAPDQRYFVDLIGSSGHTLLGLLNHVLDISKISVATWSGSQCRLIWSPSCSRC